MHADVRAFPGKVSEQSQQLIYLQLIGIEIDCKSGSGVFRYAHLYPPSRRASPCCHHLDDSCLAVDLLLVRGCGVAALVDPDVADRDRHRHRDVDDGFDAADLSFVRRASVAASSAGCDDVGHPE